MKKQRLFRLEESTYRRLTDYGLLLNKSGAGVIDSMVRFFDSFDPNEVKDMLDKYTPIDRRFKS